MRYPKLRELKEAIRALIKGPYTSSYPFKPHTPYERFRGRPYFHEEDCIGCGACTQVCPTGAVEYKDQTHDGVTKRILTVHWDVCIFCGQCQANCLTDKGIVLSQEFAFATTEKREELTQVIEKEVALCECCREPIVPVDQYRWVCQRLGPLVFSNASLLLYYLRTLKLSLQNMIFSSSKSGLLRQDRIRILCPRCRRDAVLKS
ncbi:MAG: 4Fe-4S binding protein [Candidatus Omnitrophica bacterium]|nr:4Fe-4S binding protein [Candidatus Omnitrophota bacterium]